MSPPKSVSSSHSINYYITKFCWHHTWEIFQKAAMVLVKNCYFCPENRLLKPPSSPFFPYLLPMMVCDRQRLPTLLLPNIVQSWMHLWKYKKLHTSYAVEKKIMCEKRRIFISLKIAMKQQCHWYFLWPWMVASCCAMCALCNRSKYFHFNLPEAKLQ